MVQDHQLPTGRDGRQRRSASAVVIILLLALAIGICLVAFLMYATRRGKAGGHPPERTPVATEETTQGSPPPARRFSLPPSPSESADAAVPSDASPYTKVVIGGHVRDDQGSPVVGIGIQVDSRDKHLATLTDAEGAYRVELAEGGGVHITAVRPGQQPVIRNVGLPPEKRKRGVGGDDWKFFVAADGETRLGVDLLVKRRDLEIAGIVVGADGQPVEGAQVQAVTSGLGKPSSPGPCLSLLDIEATAMSGAGGSFRLVRLASGKHTVAAEVPTLSAFGQTDGVEAGATGVEIRLRRYAALAGRVLNSSHEPVSGFNILVQYEPASAASFEWTCAMDVRNTGFSVARPKGQFGREFGDTSEFGFWGLAPGTYRIAAFDLNKTAASEQQVVVLGAGEERRDLVFVLGDKPTLKWPGPESGRR